ncbi:MAG TPA: RNB domain-containing ribonuclease, partial [Solirubrobacteraceae bacterium]|nr:RNB domain-containing ribonuclease [Solirubrobacteraceae bacterium]
MTARAGARARALDTPGPVPAGSFAAVLEKRARFIVAEPLFAQRDRDGSERGRPARVTVPAGPSRARGSVGDLVLVQAARRRSGARVVRVLGRPDVAHDVIEALLIDRGARRGFDHAVHDEARAARDRVLHRGLREVAAGQRRDLRPLATFTIDPATARDCDDAISAESLPGGATRVWVHIADVSAHVPEGSLVDREARERGTSIYVPGAVEPMLPEELSNDACSLRPGVDRPAVTVELELHGARVQRAS